MSWSRSGQRSPDSLLWKAQSWKQSHQALTGGSPAGLLLLLLPLLLPLLLGGRELLARRLTLSRSLRTLPLLLALLLLFPDCMARLMQWSAELPSSSRWTKASKVLAPPRQPLCARWQCPKWLAARDSGSRSIRMMRACGAHLRRGAWQAARGGQRRAGWCWLRACGPMGVRPWCCSMAGGWLQLHRLSRPSSGGTHCLRRQAEQGTIT
jgi:hypothetical protein